MIQGKFVALPEWIMRTLAWKSLTPTARCIWIEVARRWKGPGTNNGDIILSVREIAELLNIGKSTAARAIAELVEKGFLRITQEAGFEWRDGRRQRRAQRYALTHEPAGGALAATKDFLKWQPAAA